MMLGFVGASALPNRAGRAGRRDVGRARCGRARRAPVMDASQGGEPNKKLSKSEQMALKLGRNLEEEKAKSASKAAADRQDVAGEDLRNRVLAVIGVVVGVTTYFQEKTHPLSGSFLLEKMAAQSMTLDDALRSGRPTVVEFYADWCKNCKEMAPHVKNLENKYTRRVNFVVVDGDSEANADLVDLFGVDGLPHISILDALAPPVKEFDPKDVKATFVGYTPEGILDEDLAALLKHENLPHPGFDLADILRARTDDTPY